MSNMIDKMRNNKKIHIIFQKDEDELLYSIYNMIENLELDKTIKSMDN